MNGEIWGESDSGGPNTIQDLCRLKSVKVHVCH